MQQSQMACKLGFVDFKVFTFLFKTPYDFYSSKLFKRWNFSVASMNNEE